MAAINFSVTLANGVQEFGIPGGSYSGATWVTARFGTPAVTGTAKIEYQLIGDTAWRLFDKASAVPLSGAWAYYAPGPVSRVRLTQSSVTGGADMQLWVIASGAEGFPPKAFEGYRALNVQGYNETNVKLGLQFYVQIALPTIAAGNTANIYFKTGSVPCLVKLREFGGRGEAVSIQVFKQPTVTANGTPVTVQNFNDQNAAAPTMQVFVGATVSNNGTPWGDPQRIYGASATGQRASGNLVPGGDRVLKTNSSYLVVISNNIGGSGSADFDYFLTWGEVEPDLPIR